MVAASKLKADQRRLDTGIVYAMPSQVGILIELENCKLN